MKHLITTLLISSISAVAAPIELKVDAVHTKDKPKETEFTKKYPNAPKDTGAPDTSTKLKFTLQNGTKESQTLTLRYWIIGKDTKSNKTSSIAGKDEAVSLNPNETKAIESTDYRDQLRPEQNPKGFGLPVWTGSKITGWGVQLIKDNKVVSEKFSNPSFDKVVGATGTEEPAPAYKRTPQN